MSSENLEARVAALESWRDSNQVGMNYQQKYLEERFDRIDRRLDRYDAHISKFIWAMVMIVIAAFGAFVIKGGLAP